MFNWQLKNFEGSNFEQSIFILFLFISLNNLNKDSAYSGYFDLSHMNLIV